MGRSGSTILKGVVRDGRNKKVASERRLEGDEEARNAPVWTENVPAEGTARSQTLSRDMPVRCRGAENLELSERS